ncbi:MAG: exonuclease SbcCD subunit D [Salinivirgaceae bacterium]
MKILHTADWHLGKKLETYSRHSEQVAVMNEITELADKEQVDALIVSGDLFDTFNPPVESVDLFYKSLKRMTNNGKRAVICIAGNHDSPDRIEAPDPLAKECGIIFAGYPNSRVAPFKLDTGLELTQSAEGFIELKLPSIAYPLRILLTPYANEYRFRTFLGSENQEEALSNLIGEQWRQLAETYCDTHGVNMLAAHLFMSKAGTEPEPEPDDEKPILHVGGAQIIDTSLIPLQMQYVALGHLHRYHQVGGAACPVVYSGSPIAYSFGEADQQKYVSLISLEPSKNAVVEKLPLNAGKRLLRVKITGVSEAIRWLEANGDALVELTLVSETFISAADRKLIMQTHNGIISIIPEVLNKDFQHETTTNIDLSKSMEALFIDYFTSVKGMPPDTTLLDLFKEVLANESFEN